jgi:hypothetical protein
MDGMLAAIPMAVAVLALGVILGFMFKRPLFAWLNRVRQVKAGDTVIDMTAQAEQQVIASNNSTNVSSSAAGLAATASGSLLPSSSAAVASTPSASPAANAGRLEALRNFGVSPLIIEREEVIHRDLESVTGIDREGILIRHLAVAQLEWKAEEIYRLIYGSQIALLEHLNIYGPESEQRLVDLFMKPAAAKYPGAYEKITTDAYFRYLETSLFIVRSADGTISITPAGKGFLEWIAARGILVSKMF